MAIVTVGIDLAKNVFAVHGVNESGKAELVRPEVPRAKLLELIAHLNRPGFHGGCLVKVKPGFRSSRRVAGSSLPQLRPVEYTQSAPAVGGG